MFEGNSNLVDQFTDARPIINVWMTELLNYIIHLRLLKKLMCRIVLTSMAIHWTVSTCAGLLRPFSGG